MVNSAKAILLSEDIKTNTQAGIISQFDEFFVDTKRVELGASFSDIIYQIKVLPPTEKFAKNYINTAVQFLAKVKIFRENELTVRN